MAFRESWRRAHVTGFAGWGEGDCLHFALSAAAEAGRRNLLGEIPRYKTRLGALRALTRLGFRSLSDALDFHCTRIPSARSRPFDIAMMDPDSRLGACGIVLGPDALFLSESGVIRMPVRGLRVWRAA